jgi:hypothetical protein
MNLSDIQLPKELETDGSAKNIRKVLAACTIKFDVVYRERNGKASDWEGIVTANGQFFL